MTRYDQRAQKVDVQYNIDNSTVIVVADGFLRTLGEDSPHRLLSGLKRALKELPEDSDKKENLEDLIRTICAFSTKDWESFLASSDPNAAITKQGLGLLVLGLFSGGALGAGLALSSQSAMNQLSSKKPVTDSQTEASKMAAKHVHLTGTIEKLFPDGVSFSYYLIGCAQAHSLEGDFSETLTLVGFAERIDQNNPFLISFRDNLSPDLQSEDVQAEVDTALDLLSRGEESMVPISNAAAKAVISAAASTTDVTGQFLGILEEVLAPHIATAEEIQDTVREIEWGHDNGGVAKNIEDTSVDEF